MVKNKKWLGFFALLTMIGCIGAFMILTQGHGVLGTGQYVTWGILISTYVFFVVSSTGLCLISSLGHVFGVEPFSVVGKRSVVLAIITLIAGFVLMGLELGHPFRLINVLFSPNFSSAIFWMGALYGLYLLLLFIELHYLYRNDHKKAQVFGLVGFISAIVAHSNLGAVFGFLHSRPYWEGPYIPIYFILSALLSGTAILTVIFTFVERKREASGIIPALSRLLTLFIALTIFFSAWKLLTGLYGEPAGKYEAIMALVSGPLSIHFWLFEVAFGMLIPFGLLLWRGERGAFIAAISALIGIFFMRYDLVIAGQIVPMEVINAVVPTVGWKYYEYTPTFAEWAVVALGFGLTGLGYLLCENKLSLDSGSEPQAVQTRVSVTNLSH